jgi:hypothetical protein
MDHNDPKRVENRLLWRISRHRLTPGMFLFADLSAEQKRLIAGVTKLRGKPLIAFAGATEWTVVTTEELVSWHGEKLNRIGLSSIRSIEPGWGAAEEFPTKLNVQFLLIGPEETKIWAPQGAPLFALWNTLSPWVARTDDSER